jgi:16S rRNA (cytidine1402-2'-O)-methyltransferase
MKKGKLYLVGLPIGNWEDTSERAKRYISTAKNLVIEREEAFEHIWSSLGMKRPDSNIISIEFESKAGEPDGIPYELRNMDKIMALLDNGEDVYIISDEGMPGIADPGSHIVGKAIRAGVEISATPGPSVAIAAVAVTGTMHNFTFDSFLPYERKDKIKFLMDRANLHTPLVLVLRNVKKVDEPGQYPILSEEISEFLEDGCKIFGVERHAALCYNLTKDDERVVRGTFGYLKEYFDTTERSIWDQITVVIDHKNGNMPI